MGLAPPYGRYAAIYDATGQDAFSRRLWPVVLRLVQRLGWTGSEILELACGTGAAAERMAEDGYRVVGADLSRAMLLEARSRELPRRVPFVQADMRRLPFGPLSFDLITSFYDSVNYLLTAAELAALCAEAARVLRPRGLLVFDLNTPFTLKEHWRGVSLAEAGEDEASIWITHWDARRQASSLRATFFVRGDDGRWDRFDEVHDEHGFEADEIAAAARDAGLTVVHTEDTQTSRRPARTSRRVLYVLRRER